MSPEDVAYRRYISDLSDVCRAQLCAAGWLLLASASLVDAAGTRDSEDDAMLARLGEIRPADDDQAKSDAGNDREFLLDRAAAHRRKAEVMTSNALQLFEVLTDLLASHVSDDAELGYAEELGERLAPYLSAINQAVGEFTTITWALDAALGDASEWQGQLSELRGARLFLSEESALFSDLLEGRVDA